MRGVEEGVTEESQETGKVMRASAKSSPPTAGTEKTTSSPPNDTEPSRVPWPQARTLPSGSTDWPAGTGRWTVHVTSWEVSSQPSDTNFQ